MHLSSMVATQIGTLFVLSSLVCATLAQTASRGKTARRDDPIPTETQLSRPADLAIDNAGNLFFVESMTLKIFRIDASLRVMTRIAGNDSHYVSGDGGPAVLAGVNPTAIAVDRSGNLLIAEISRRIRRVDTSTQIISTIAGTDNLGDGGTGDGGPASLASFRGPVGVAVDSQGNVFVSDSLDHRIRRIDAATGIISTYAGGGSRELGDGGLATMATLKFPDGIAIDGQDNLFIADYDHHRVRRVDVKTGIITTIAGTGDPEKGLKIGAADKVNMRYPSVLAVDSEGNIFTNGGRGHHILRIDGKTKMVTVYVGSGELGFSGDGGLATKAKINGPSGMVLDKGGNLYFADSGNNRIRRVDSKTGVITTVAGSGEPK